MIRPIYGEPEEATSRTEEAWEDVEEDAIILKQEKQYPNQIYVEKLRSKPKVLQQIREEDEDMDPTRHELNREPHKCKEVTVIVVVQIPCPQMLVPLRLNEKDPKTRCIDILDRQWKIIQKGVPPLMEGAMGSRGWGDCSRSDLKPNKNQR